MKGTLMNHNEEGRQLELHLHITFLNLIWTEKKEIAMLNLCTQLVDHPAPKKERKEEDKSLQSTNFQIDRISQ